MLKLRPGYILGADLVGWYEGGSVVVPFFTCLCSIVNDERFDLETINSNISIFMHNLLGLVHIN